MPSYFAIERELWLEQPLYKVFTLKTLLKKTYFLAKNKNLFSLPLSLVGVCSLIYNSIHISSLIATIKKIK